MMNKLMNIDDDDKLYQQIREILLTARQKAYQSIGSVMVETYWEIGRRIVEEEQDGQLRAQYGKSMLESLSGKLTEEFGKGFNIRNLRYMRSFYLKFPIRNALRSELTWTHYRSLLRVESDEARNWYLEEAIRNQWSSRQLDRQISTLYYERLLRKRNFSNISSSSAALLKGMGIQCNRTTAEKLHNCPTLPFLQILLDGYTDFVV